MAAESAQASQAEADAKLKSVHIGVDASEYKFKPVSEKGRNIGFVSRMCHENGVDILVDAFILLKQKDGFEDVRLVLTGGSTGDDRKFLSDILNNNFHIMHGGGQQGRKANNCITVFTDSLNEFL